MKKSNTWNIRLFVDDTIVPWTQRNILKIVGFYMPAVHELPVNDDVFIIFFKFSKESIFCRISIILVYNLSVQLNQIIKTAIFLCSTYQLRPLIPCL